MELPTCLLPLLFLSLLCFAPATGQSAQLAQPSLVSRGTPTGENLLRNAILLANKRRSVPLRFVLTVNATLTRALPILVRGSGIYLVGSNSKGGVIIDGQSRFPLFRGSFNCSIGVENVTIRNMSGGVFSGGCQVSAKQVTFANNSAPNGAVLNSAVWTPLRHVFVDCAILDNSATSGDGGAFFLGRPFFPRLGGPSLFISSSSFDTNAALRGSGGAIYAAGSPVRIVSCAFATNTCPSGGGGAVYSLASSVHVINSTFYGGFAARGGVMFLSGSTIQSLYTVFFDNEATTGGGALYAENTQGLTLQFCQNTFVQNFGKLPRPNDMFLSVGMFSRQMGTLQLCQNNVTGGIVTARNIVMSKSCRGCTGCANDCNANGVCAISGPFFIPKCACRAHYDPSSACSACSRGYSLPSKCAACSGGYFRPRSAPASCRLCPGVPQVAAHFGLSARPTLTSAAFAATARQCQQRCISTQFCGRSASGSCRSLQYCNAWAYIWPRKSALPACKMQCLLFRAKKRCGVSPVVQNSTLGISYQIYEKSGIRCLV